MAESSLLDKVDMPIMAVNLIIFGLIEDHKALDPPDTVRQEVKTVGLRHVKAELKNPCSYPHIFTGSSEATILARIGVIPEIRVTILPVPTILAERTHGYNLPSTVIVISPHCQPRTLEKIRTGGTGSK